MNNVLEYIYNHPKETKRIIGITYEQLIKLIAKAQIIESQKKEAIAKTEKRLIKIITSTKRRVKEKKERSEVGKERWYAKKGWKGN